MSEPKTTRRKRSSPEETKRDKFQRLSKSRTEAIEKQLKTLSNLSNTQHYDFGSADVARIFQRINREVQLSRNRFDSALALKKQSLQTKKSR